jgi:NodT family efflux transporter outer membrane factor (OMF) lipoprotein
MLVLMLAGCVNDVGLHAKAKPIHEATLSQKHALPVLPKHPVQDAWWRSFKDPTLSALIQTALADSPTPKIAEARVARAAYLADEARSFLWPSIDFSGYAQRERFSTFGLVPPPFNGNTYNIGELGFNFNYDFDFWGKYRNAYAARQSEQQAFAADLALARLVLSTAVAEAYFQAQGDSKALQVTRAQLQVAKSLAALIRLRAEHGIEADIPLKTVDANVEALQLLVAQYERSQQLARHELAELLGNNPARTTLLMQSLHFRPTAAQIPHNLPAHLLGYRPDVQAARERAEAASHWAQVAHARLFPDINLNGLFSYQSVGFGHLFDPQSQNNAITGAVDLPIFDAGARRAEVGARYAAYDEAVQTYNETVLRALQEVADKLTTLHTLDSEIDHENIALTQMRERYKLFLLRYNHGIIDELPVLEAKSLWLSHQTKRINLQMRRMQASAALLKALGGHQGVA